MPCTMLSSSNTLLFVELIQWYGTIEDNLSESLNTVSIQLMNLFFKKWFYDHPFLGTLCNNRR